MSTTTKTNLRPDAALVAAALAKVAAAPRVVSFEQAINEMKHEPAPSLWSAYVQWATDATPEEQKSDELERVRRAAKIDKDHHTLSERPDTAYAKAIADARAAQFVERLEAAVAEHLADAPEQMTIPLAKLVLVKKTGSA